MKQFWPVIILFLFIFPKVFFCQTNLGALFYPEHLLLRFDSKGKVNEVYEFNASRERVLARRKGKQITVEYFSDEFNYLLLKDSVVAFLFNPYDFEERKTVVFDQFKVLTNYFSKKTAVAADGNYLWKFPSGKKIRMKRHKIIDSTILSQYRFFNTHEGYDYFGQLNGQHFYGSGQTGIIDSMERKIFFFKPWRKTPSRIITCDSIFFPLLDNTYFFSGKLRSIATKDSTVFFSKHGKIIFVERDSLLKVYGKRNVPTLIIDFDTKTVIEGDKKINVDKFLRKKLTKLVRSL